MEWFPDDAVVLCVATQITGRSRAFNSSCSCETGAVEWKRARSGLQRGDRCLLVSGFAELEALDGFVWCHMFHEKALMRELKEFFGRLPDVSFGSGV